MSLKEEIGKIEEEEEPIEVEERLRRMHESIRGLSRRIDMVVGYIDNEEPLREKKAWQRGFNAGYKEGEKHAMKTAKEHAKEDVKPLSEKMEDDTDQSKAYDKRVIEAIAHEAIQKALGADAFVSNFGSLVELLAMQNLAKAEAVKPEQPKKEPEQ